VGLTGTTEKGTVEIVIGIMITVVDTTADMTMIVGMTADMIVVTMIMGMTAIVIVIVTIETTEGAGHRPSDRSMIARFADQLQRHGLPVIQA
jgi:uncharacterized membrane protein